MRSDLECIAAHGNVLFRSSKIHAPLRRKDAIRTSMGPPKLSLSWIWALGKTLLGTQVLPPCDLSVPEIVLDLPLHSAQIILAFRIFFFFLFSRNVFGHYEEGIGIFAASIRTLPRFYQAHQSICLTSALIEAASK